MQKQTEDREQWQKLVAFPPLNRMPEQSGIVEEKVSALFFKGVEFDRFGHSDTKMVKVYRRVKREALRKSVDSLKGVRVS